MFNYLKLQNLNFVSPRAVLPSHLSTYLLCFDPSPLLLLSSACIGKKIMY